MSESVASYTKDAPWIVAQVEDENEFSRHITYLLPDGTRRRVTIDVSMDSEDLRRRMGDALASGNTGNVRGKR